ncbi:MAG TPA: FkbM family methyltransferase [Pyrinomonadaceae bacterium]|nr:FkbM family methyltransferase [Pyrinomonadaceae bacterium]
MSVITQTLNNSKRFAKKQALNHLPEWALTPLRKRHYLRVLRQVSEDYAPDFVVLKRLVKPGEVVVDLGAHVGACTKFLSDLVGETGAVYSVEPFPLTFEILQQSVDKLKLSNVQLINCAVSDASGKLMMEVPTFAESGESFYDARLIPAGATSSLRQAAVDVKTVDSLFSGRQRAISFIKCDVEGQELQTLRGAKRVIDTDRPMLMLEVSLMSQETHTEVRELLAGFDYQEFCFEESRLRPWQANDRPVDVFFFQPEHLNKASDAGFEVNR